ncbi:hypothetical protein G6M89_14600 [Natronolimnobius sp. AArcel1]|uniref:hypothetical protein n=1 Tax=Natronolimnobius sp. AArcel1 TaxID=1679093 RepID=UPI0013EDFC5A|nr:hypothetical protein [Natronolimnobius sp. AArcel1]NGM70224.1 hypothetical protein [Natronolimnobius sp. AArcel1]
MEKRLKRRHLLVGLGASSLVATSGCTDRLELGNDDDELRCRGEYRYLRPELEDRAIVYDEQMPGVSLEVPAEVEELTEFTVTLTNSSDREFEIYDDDRLAVQALGDDGAWHTIFGVEKDYEWSEQTTALSPGDDRSWTLNAAINDSGLERYSFCSTPTPDQYRLLFWGFPNDPSGVSLVVAQDFEIIEQQDNEH